MTEQDFIQALSRALKALPDEQREDILGEYRSHFFEARERGKSEESVAAAFGDPRTIAQTYMAEHHFQQLQSPPEGLGLGGKFSHLVRGSLMLFTLLFFNFFFMLWPILAAAIALLVSWIMVSVTILVSVVLAILGLIGGTATLVVPNVSTQFALFFYSLGSGLLAALLGVALYHLSLLAGRGILRYVKLNINLLAA